MVNLLGSINWHKLGKAVEFLTEPEPSILSSLCEARNYMGSFGPVIPSQKKQVMGAGHEW